MNTWQIIPKVGITFGGIRLTFEDTWEDVIQKLKLDRDYDIQDLTRITSFDNILDTGACMQFEFDDLLVEILFFYGNLYLVDISLIDSDIDYVIGELVRKEIKVLYDYSNRCYICPDLGIYFSTSRGVGGESLEVIHVGIYSSEWGDSDVYEVTSPVLE